MRRYCFLLLMFFTLRLTAQPADTVRISLNAIAGLQYDQVRFAVKPGAIVKIVLTNRDEMNHNLVFTRPEKRIEVVEAAIAMGNQGPSQNYVPNSSEVLAFIPLLEPGKTDSVIMKVPGKTGIYPYVCTFPGHGFAMYGAMYVTYGNLPSAADDPNIPLARRKDAPETASHDHMAPSGHPYQPSPPFFYRVLMPDAGPAAIAVSLPQELSYCWDAGTCRLRYAWSGGFLDMNDYWNIKGELSARILGTIFYRDKTTFPLRTGTPDHIPVVEFKGYQLIRQYPEFHYLLDGMDVYELIQPKTDGSGLVRIFRIPSAQQSVWFVHGLEDGVAYESSVGKWNGEKLLLSPTDAKKIVITMTKAEGQKP